MWPLPKTSDPFVATKWSYWGTPQKRYTHWQDEWPQFPCQNLIRMNCFTPSQKLHMELEKMDGRSPETSTSIPFVGNPYISPKNGVGNAIVFRFSWLGKWVGRSLVHLEIVWRSGNFGVWGGLETSNQELHCFVLLLGRVLLLKIPLHLFFLFCSQEVWEIHFFFPKPMPVFDSNQQTWEPQTDFNSSRFFSFYKQTGCVKVKGVLPKFRKFSTQLDNFQKHTFFLWTHPLNLVVHITPKKQTTGNLTIMKLWWPDLCTA